MNRAGNPQEGHANTATRRRRNRKAPCWFAVIPKEVVREIASKGGKKAQEMGVAHRWTSEEARAAARLAVEKKKAKRLLAERMLQALTHAIPTSSPTTVTSHEAPAGGSEDSLS